jgi:hypothetical protein
MLREFLVHFANDDCLKSANNRSQRKQTPFAILLQNLWKKPKMPLYPQSTDFGVQLWVAEPENLYGQSWKFCGSSTPLSGILGLISREQR